GSGCHHRSLGAALSEGCRRLFAEPGLTLPGRLGRLKRGELAARRRPSMSLPLEKASELKQLIHQPLSKVERPRARSCPPCGLERPAWRPLARPTTAPFCRGLEQRLRRRTRDAPSCEFEAGGKSKSLDERTSPESARIIDDVMKELNFVTDSVDQELASSPKQPLFRSKPLPCACEPNFHKEFLLEVHRESLGMKSKVSMYPPLNQTLSEEVNAERDSEDGANLLCSLLGYGLEAFVCVGTKAKEYLMLHPQIYNPDESPVAEQPKPSCPYRTIGCVLIIKCSWASVSPLTQ
ncbi:hypothetical protein HPG69_003815, partial [Diceros bicornis minor]